MNEVNESTPVWFNVDRVVRRPRTNREVGEVGRKGTKPIRAHRRSSVSVVTETETADGRPDGRTFARAFDPVRSFRSARGCFIGDRSFLYVYTVYNCSILFPRVHGVHGVDDPIPSMHALVVRHDKRI